VIATVTATRNAGNATRIEVGTVIIGNLITARLIVTVKRIENGTRNVRKTATAYEIRNALASPIRNIETTTARRPLPALPPRWNHQRKVLIPRRVLEAAFLSKVPVANPGLRFEVQVAVRPTCQNARVSPPGVPHSRRRRAVRSRPPMHQRKIRIHLNEKPATESVS
jgi:hypothetical protein